MSQQNEGRARQGVSDAAHFKHLVTDKSFPCMNKVHQQGPHAPSPLQHALCTQQGYQQRRGVDWGLHMVRGARPGQGYLLPPRNQLPHHIQVLQWPLWSGDSRQPAAHGR